MSQQLLAELILPNGGSLAGRRGMEIQPRLAQHLETLTEVASSLEALEVADLEAQDRLRLQQARQHLERASRLLESNLAEPA